MNYDVDHWIAAEDATEWHRSQVQCFLYRPGPEDRMGDLDGLHVIRDLALDRGLQVIWQRDASHDEYEAAHRAMMVAHRRYCVGLIIAAYSYPAPVCEGRGAE